MIEEPPIFLFAIFFMFAMGCVCHSCGRVDIEREAISHGYATYDSNGLFQWREQQK